MVTSVLLEEAMRRGRFRGHAEREVRMPCSHLAVRANVKAMQKNPLFCLGKETKDFQ
jgi:hypothetical protein